jgi:hypothetical protein
MTKKASVIIGGEAYDLQPLVFAQMRKVWPLLQLHMSNPTAPAAVNAEDVEAVGKAMNAEMDAMQDTIKIMSIALRDPSKTPEWIEDNLFASEMHLLRDSLLQLLDISGLISSGNAKAELDRLVQEMIQTPQTLMGTSTPSSDT